MIAFEIRNLRLIQGVSFSISLSWHVLEGLGLQILCSFFLIHKQFSGFLRLTNDKNGTHSYFQKLKVPNDYTVCSQATETHSDSDCFGLGFYQVSMVMLLL